MRKFFQSFGEKRREYQERLDAKVAYHLEFSDGISDYEMEEIKDLVRTEIERDRRYLAQMRFLFFMLVFVVLSVLLYFILH